MVDPQKHDIEKMMMMCFTEVAVAMVPLSSLVISHSLGVFNVVQSYILSPFIFVTPPFLSTESSTVYLEAHKLNPAVQLGEQFHSLT